MPVVKSLGIKIVVVAAVVVRGSVQNATVASKTKKARLTHKLGVSRAYMAVLDWGERHVAHHETR